MATTNFIDHLLFGDHASRPAFGAVPEGTLYACSDHDLIYQSDGTSAWSTWADIGGTGLTDPTTTRGDIIRRGAAAIERLALGTAGKLLKSDGTDPDWAYPTFIGVKAYHSTTEARNNQVASLDSEEFDTSAFHDLVTNNSRLTVPAGLGGYYHIIGSSSTAASTAQTIVLRKNGTTNLLGTTRVNDGRGFETSTVVALVATDYVEILFPGNSTFGDASLNEEKTTLQMFLIGV